MHELGIAQRIVESAVEEAGRIGAGRVTSIDVEVGELTQVEVKPLKEALELLITGPKLAGAQVRVSLVRASFSCRKCGREWGMDEARRQLAEVPDELRVLEPESAELPLHFLPYLYPSFVRCPGCGSSDSSVREGEDVYVKRVTFDG